MLHKHKLTNGGKVTAGEFPGFVPSYRFNVIGGAWFSCGPAASGFYFTNTVSDNAPVLLPQWGNASYIGQSNGQIFRIYTKYLTVNGVMVSSDLKLKENIKPLATGSLKNLLKMNLVKFDYKEEFFVDSFGKGANRELLLEKRKNKTGFIAQEVKEILPELVEFNKNADCLEINYLGFIPELVKALQEQQQTIEKLQAELLYTQQNCCLATKPIITKQGVAEETIVISARLDQNKPNPFKEGTQISYFIPEQAQKAGIYIYDLNGKQVKQLPITEKGEGSLRINGQELTAGMYLYTLIIDSMPIDTKRMILTE